MLTHYRRRRGVYPVAPRPAVSRRAIATIVFFLAVAYFFGGGILRLFGWGGPIERLPSTVRVEDRGAVNVRLEDGNTKRAEDGMKLFAGEQIVTGGNGYASLKFFDGTVARLGADTSVRIEESTREQEAVRLVLALERGTLWVSVTDPSASGATIRQVRTSLLSYALPPRTDAVFSPSSLAVFGAAGEGVSVALSRHPTIAVGEGQELLLPQGANARDLSRDLYDYRSALRPSSPQAVFAAESRALLRSRPSSASSLPATQSGNDLLSVTAPREGETVATGTVTVTGRAGAKVVSVKVNGHPVPLDTESRDFSQIVSLPQDQTEFSLRIQALDAAGNPMAEATRTVRRTAATPAPAITSPAKDGETFQTNLAEIIIRGTSPSSAAGIEVNGYRLQLFTPSKGTWSYLASLALGNMKTGTNTYDVVVIDAEGRKSNPVRLTIVQGDTADSGTVVTGSSSSAAAPAPQVLPQNAPLKPGTLRLSGAAALEGFVATGTGFILEGETDSSTATVWINNYQLQLYKPGKTTWNYIASPDLRTLKKGMNVFTVVARDKEGNILDKAEWRIEYR